MKAYFKILLITAAIQVVSFRVSHLADEMICSANGNVKSGYIFLIGFAIGLLGSMVLSVILAFRWAKTLKGRLACILLMPTNYTWLMIVLAVIWFVRAFLAMLGVLPPFKLPWVK